MQLIKNNDQTSGQAVKEPAPGKISDRISGQPVREPEPRKILARISKEKLALFFMEGEPITVKKNTLIFEASETSAFFLLDGYVSLSRDSKYGDEKIIFICGPQEMLNELVLETDSSSVTARALSECTLLKVDHSKLRELAIQDITLYEAIFRSLTGKTRKLYRQAGNNTGTYPLEKHLMVKIWKLARDCGHDTDKGRTIDFDVSVTMLANLLGAQRESVSRAISVLKKEQLILLDKKQLTVPDMERLHSMY